MRRSTGRGSEWGAGRRGQDRARSYEGSGRVVPTTLIALFSSENCQIMVPRVPNSPHPGPSCPEDGGRKLRTIKVVLILLNLVLAAALVTQRSAARSADASRSCCRGDGPEAYCCYGCCWLFPDCDMDSDCRDG